MHASSPLLTGGSKSDSANFGPETAAKRDGRKRNARRGEETGGRLEHASGGEDALLAAGGCKTL